MHKKVVIGLLGSTLDQGRHAKRWNLWRPSVSICQHEELLVDRYHLLYQEKHAVLAERIIEDIKTVSPETEVVSDKIEFSDPWDFEEVYAVLHDYARKFRFDPEKEDYLIHITTGTHVAQICLFLLTESRHMPGKLLQTSPPARKGEDASGTYTIIDLDLSRYDRIASRFLKEKKDDISFLKSGIDTRNKQFNSLVEMIEKVAIRSLAPILLTGPTGAGKSQMAKRIYELKKIHHQVKGNFIEVNCATLRGDSAMSTLFGHRKGAFTGALQDRPGLLHAADKGILFLDEIGELGTDEQAMLLRAIEEKRFLPLGSDKESQSDFQLICGTNRNLNSELSSGRFREDLLARINLWSFNIPGLKNRPEDIAPNLDYELDRFAEKTGSRVSFNKEAKQKFLEFATSGDAVWSANFRDLNGAITRMCTLSPAGRINLQTAEDEIKRLKNTWESPIADNDSESLKDILGDAYEKTDLFDRMQLSSVLQICRNSKSLSDAGRKLFNASRQEKLKANDADRLRKYLASFGMSWPDIHEKA